MRKFHEEISYEAFIENLWDILLDLIVIIVIEEYIASEFSEIRRARNLSSCTTQSIVPSY